MASIIPIAHMYISILRISLTRLIFRRKPEPIYPEINHGDLLRIQPLQLLFPFDLEKETPCSIQLTNISCNTVAYKVKTTNRDKYRVIPRMGAVMPHSSCDVTVWMRARKEVPPDMQYCRDKFLVQGIVVDHGTSVTSEMFDQKPMNQVDACKLSVIYLPPEPDRSEEEDITVNRASDFNMMSKELPGSRDTVCRCQRNSVKSLVSKLTEEKQSAIQQEPETVRHDGVLIGILSGYLLKRI